MNTIIGQPFNQRIRIAALRVALLALLPLALIVDPVLAPLAAGEVMENLGIGLIIAGVIGRFWSILYIGGHKNACIMDQGPYSVCRHPLYLFSTIAVAGFGLMLQSLVFTVLATVVIFTILSMTAAREEGFLRQTFGGKYDAYSGRVPRIFPDPRLFTTTEEITVNTTSLRRNFFDALVFIALIPVAESIEELRVSLGLFAVTLY